MSKRAKRRGESELIAHYFAPLSDASAAFGLSDDTAFLSVPDGFDLVVTKDMLVAGIHFFADDPPEKIAQKALRVNLSDLAAKGAKPFGYLLGLGLPDKWEEAWLERFCSGLKADQEAFRFPLFGGDTVKSPDCLTLSITAFGLVPKGQTLLRNKARPGQLLYVTGTIGDGALGLSVALGKAPQGLDAAHLTFLHDRYLLPQPRLACENLLSRHAIAAMDISDGLLGDAAKMAQAAGVGIEIHRASVPLSPAVRIALEQNPALWSAILAGGDDYELLFTIRPEDKIMFEKARRELGLSLTLVGSVTDGEGVTLLDEAGQPIDPGPSDPGYGSFEHF